MKTSNIRNSSSHMCSVRVPILFYDWLKAKAEKNPKNFHNNIATEINSMIEAGYDLENPPA